MSWTPSSLGIVLLLGLSLASIPGFLAIHTVSAGYTILNGNFSNPVIDPLRPRLYLAEPSTNSVVTLNTTSNQVISRVFVGSGPAGMDVSANYKELYVALTTASGLAVLNLTSLVLSRTIHLTANPVDVAAGPQGLAYVTTSEGWGYPRVVDTVNNKEIGSITGAGQIYQGALARISPDHLFLYVGERGISPASIAKFTATSSPALVGSSPFNRIGDNLQDVAVLRFSSLIYVASGFPNYVQVVNTTDWTSAGALNSGAPNSVTLAQGGLVAFVTQASDEVKQFDAQRFTLIASYGLPGQGGYVRATPDGARVYVLLYGGIFFIEAKPPVWPFGSNLKATSVGVTYSSLAWTAATDSLGVANYKIFENGSVVATVPGNNFTYTVRGLLGNTTYTFKIEAGNLDSWTSDGPSVTVKTLIPPPDFSLSTNPSILRLDEGAAATLQVTATSLYGFSQSLALSVQIPSTRLNYTLTPTTIAMHPSQNTTSQLVIRDTLTGTASPTYKITVSATNGTSIRYTTLIVNLLLHAPSGSFTYSPVPIIVNGPATFQVSTAFSFSPIASYLWDFGDGSHSQGRVVTHTYYSSGSYDVRLTIIDSSGVSNSTVQTIYVAAHSYLPGVTVGTTASYLINLSTPTSTNTISLRLDTAVLSVDGSNVTFRVDVSYGGPVVNSTSTTFNVATGFESKTILPFVLVASNLAIGDPVYVSGIFQRLTIQTISNSRLVGVLRTADSVQFSSPVVFDASWDKQTGLLASLVATIPTNSTVISASYQLVATNAWTGLTLTIASAAKSGQNPLQISFTSQVTGGEAPFTFEWAFGDGTGSSEPAPAHTFVAGNYTVSLTVSDSAGNRASATYQITLKERGITPLMVQALKSIFGQLRTVGIIAGGIYASLGLLALGIYVGRRSKRRTEALKS